MHYEKPKILYVCNPDKNVKCDKTSCYINGGECRLTAKEEFAKANESGIPIQDKSQEWYEKMIKGEGYDINKALLSSNKDDWETPQKFFDTLDEEFHFTLDPCADLNNHKCEAFYTKQDNGLNQDWGGNIVFCNPPYGRQSTSEWIKKCAEEGKKPNTTVVMLIPARTDTKAFHKYIYGKAEIRFIKGRLKFGNSNNSAPFPSMVVIFKEGWDK